MGRRLPLVESFWHSERIRKSFWSRALIRAVKELREEYPRWGKDKLLVLPRDQGHETSTATAGRILGHLKQRGEKG
jgi:hypothetical protein